jgi:uncharacterized protein YndB with AHSA1/START domain
MTPRRHIVEVEVPATPEEVWDAIATGTGITAWFVPSDVDERVGGDVAFRLGEAPDMQSRGTVTAYEPPSRFAYVERWDDVDFATEFLVEARGGGSCVVRIVSSGFGEGEEWDRQIESLDRGWRSFLDNLRIYLERFAGAPCAQVVADVRRPGEEPAEAVRWLQAALGLPATPAIGDEVSAVAPFSAGEAPSFAGVVERVAPEEVAIRTAEGIVVVSAFSWEEQTTLRLQAYLYGGDPAERAARLEPLWRGWLTALPAHA